MKRIPLCSLLVLLCGLFILNTAFAETVWKEIASDGSYGKLYSPSSIRKVEETNGVATLIQAVVKTTYTLDAAKETIANYEIGNVLTDPSQLSYSVATVEVNPQHRTIEYVSEMFFDANDKIIWSKTYDPRTEKEINSLSFEEDYYTAIIDAVFYQGEAARCKAPDRWIQLWQTTKADGSGLSVMADTSTMRQRGEDSLIYWEWMEEKDINGQVKQIKFTKKVLELKQGAYKIMQGKLWTTDKGWTPIAMSGSYVKIPTKGPEFGGLVRLRAYQKGYQYWLNRYRTDKIVKLPSKK